MRAMNVNHNPDNHRLRVIPPYAELQNGCLCKHSAAIFIPVYAYSAKNR